MSFSYDIEATDTDYLRRSRMRLELGDQRQDPNGMLPEGRNFSNAELDHFYDQESDDLWLSVARAFDSAAAEWAQYPNEIRLGPETQKLTANAYFAGRAQAIRTKRQLPGSASVAKSEYAFDVT